MTFLERLREFLGLQRQPDHSLNDHRSHNEIWNNYEQGPSHPNPSDQDIWSRFFGFGDSGRQPGMFSTFGSDPLEMHRYFEQQLDEMLHSFGFSGIPRSIGPGVGQEDFTAPDQPFHGPSSPNIRDQFLKPGYERPAIQGPKLDENLDDKVKDADWNQIFSERDKMPLQPSEPHRLAPNQNHLQVFGQSVCSKTVRNPDGSTETQRTVRDHDGNEETTIIRRFGDKEINITKKRDKYGKEETIENVINLGDKDTENFMQPTRHGWPFDWFYRGN